jgi:hypothetical protein
MTRRRLIYLVSAIWFAGVHLLAHVDVWRDPTHLVPGPLGDNTVMLWNLGWVRYALSHGHPGFWFQNAYYPQGFLFLFSTHTWLDGVLGFLASPLLPDGPEGCVLWANLVQLFATTATGLLAMAALAQFGIRRWQFQLLGATAVTFCWFRAFAAGGHYHFYGTEWMMAALAAAARARRYLRVELNRAGWRWGMVSGALVGVAFLNDQTHAVFAAILFAIILGSLFFSRHAANRAVLAAISGGALTALLVASIHIVPIVSALAAGKLKYEVTMLDTRRLVDASGTFLPPPQSLLSSDDLADWRQSHKLVTAEGQYLGAVGVLFVLLSWYVAAVLRPANTAARRLRRQLLVASAAGTVFLFLSLGEYFTWGPDSYFVLPGAILRHIPALNNIRMLQRWIWPAQLCLAVGATSALTLAWRRVLPLQKQIVLLACGLFAAAEGMYYPPVEPTNIRGSLLEPPMLVNALRKVPKDGSVLFMPVELTYGYSNHMQFLAGYDIPMAMSYTARPPFEPRFVPFKQAKWTTETAHWLQEHRVRTVVFYDFDGTLNTSPLLKEYAGWIAQARAINRELNVLNRHGNSVFDKTQLEGEFLD